MAKEYNNHTYTPRFCRVDEGCIVGVAQPYDTLTLIEFKTGSSAGIEVLCDTIILYDTSGSMETPLKEPPKKLDS